MRGAYRRSALRGLLLLALCLAPGLRAHGDGAAFPRPAELEEHVQFWIEVFTEHDGDWTVIHDEDDPRIRYETVGTAGLNERARRDLVRERRVHYIKTLESLSMKPKERWSDEQKRVAALFPTGSGVSRFIDAAGKVRSQRGIRDQFRASVIRSGRWKETIEGILAAYGIPEEIAALPHIESSYRPDALSKAGAVGVWQFTSGTGKRFLRIDRYVDERRDVYLSTHAAARYLKEAHEKIGSWPLTITSYNHGVNGILRAQRELGTSDLVRLIREYDGPYFGFSSKNFYAEFLAALEVTGNVPSYFGALESDSLERVERFVLPEAARVDAIAKAFRTTTEEFCRLNPALLDPVVEGRLPAPAGSVLNVPAGRVEDLAAAFDSIPAAARRGGADPGEEYRVRAGDTLGSIARRHGVSVADLQEINGMGRSTQIKTGQRLLIPDGLN